jgi:hypothetical protein
VLTRHALLPARVRPSRRPALRLLGTLVLVLGLLLPGAAPALAAGQLDQQQTTQPTIFPFGLGSNLVQTFTAGLTGNLDQVSLALAFTAGAGTFTVDILSVAGGVPTTTVLTSVTQSVAILPPALFPFPFTAFPLNPPVPVVAGTQYAIRVSPPGAILVWGGDFLAGNP